MATTSLDIRDIQKLLRDHRSAASQNYEDISDRIPEILSRLISVYKPVAVYLYGSYVWGEPDKASDLDFFIVLKDAEQGHAERIRAGLRGLIGIHANVDIVVFTEKEIEARKNHPSTLIHKVLSRGVKLYGAA